MVRSSLIRWGVLALNLVALTAAAEDKYASVQKLLYQVAQQNPGRARVIHVGESDSGKPIEGLAIGDGSVHTLIVATHHGNEFGSTEVAKAAAQSLAANPIAGQTVFIVPVLNISGYNAGQRRETAQGTTFDPNRDYPGPCGTEGPHRLKSTRAIAQFIESEKIVTSATLHTFFPAVTYPWGVSSDDLNTNYDSIFENLAHLATELSGYQTGNSTEIVYAADGSFEDYVYWKHGVWSLLFELGYSHNPNAAAIKQLVEQNVPGLRKFLEEAPRERAEKHDFDGQCDVARVLQRHERD
jgi:carboxypeptidase T